MLWISALLTDYFFFFVWQTEAVTETQEMKNWTIVSSVGGALRYILKVTVVNHIYACSLLFFNQVLHVSGVQDITAAISFVNSRYVQ